jgi:uncharacterized protein YbjQ (UPF0145 family)
MKRKMIVTTTNEIAGRKIVEYLGIVRGIVVRSPGIGKNIMGSFAAIGGGNIVQFEEVCEQARKEAHVRMVEHAREREADAIIGMRYDANEFSANITEVLAYGTAVALDDVGEEVG